MEKYYKEKHLQATKYKIENVIRQQDFLLRNKWKVLFFIGSVSLWIPTRAVGHYTSERETILEKSGYNYVSLVLITALVCIIFCLLYHYSSKYQDSKKLKELRVLEQQLEKEISELG
ncbi:hypothetical protein [uncultured Tenacibaculum sp.]|uniref:hypothetical protein n=1 Tax=uncultured Tenacibaculum sp. TaxID=174713 RepID=UPI002619C365|nr:hypothetical protein [uncultured Tenacibaculum sp.]